MLERKQLAGDDFYCKEMIVLALHVYSAQNYIVQDVPFDTVLVLFMFTLRLSRFP